jgi:capsular polysaccharide biosynthesis protein
MELKAYWRALRRRWPWLLIPAAAMLVVVLATYRPPPPLYHVGIRFATAQLPSSGATASDEERLANWQVAEYVAGTLTTWVRSGQFAALVSARLEGSGLTISPAEVQAAVASDNTRTLMTLYMTHPDRAILERLIAAGSDALVEENALALPQLGGEPAELVQMDRAIINQVPPGIVRQLELPLRFLLALGIGVVLALAAEYLDPTIRDRESVEAMGLSLVGIIPKK